MTKKLKIRFVKFERALAMQILEQEGKFKSREHIMIGYAPAFEGNYIYLRGGDSEYDNSLSCKDFFSNAERDKYLNNVIKWISEEQFSSLEEFEVGKLYAFKYKRENPVKFFGRLLTILPENVEYRYIVEAPFLKKGWEAFGVACPPYASPQIDGDIYTWEMEVSE